MPSTNTLRLAALFALVATLLSACSIFEDSSTSDDTSRNESGEITEGGDVGVFRLQVGDCFPNTDAFSGLIESVEAVPCSDLHEAEVVGLYDIAGDTFPEDMEAETERCLTEFETYTGVSYNDSPHELFPLRPTQQTWDELNDREVVCIAVLDAPATASIQAAG